MSTPSEALIRLFFLGSLENAYKGGSLTRQCNLPTCISNNPGFSTPINHIHHYPTTIALVAALYLRLTNNRE